MNLIKKYSLLLFLIILLTAPSKTQTMYKDLVTNAIPLTLSEYYKEKKKEINTSIESTLSNPCYIYQIVNRPEWGDSGYTPVCITIEMNDLPCTQILLSHGADVNARIEGVFFSRPVLFARTLEMVKLLHLYKADLFVINEGNGETKGMNLLQIIKRYFPNNTSLINYLTAIGMR